MVISSFSKKPGPWALLNGNDGIESELSLGVGWQDPAVIRETGLCVWRSGDKPVLHFKRNGDFLHGHMALHYTDIPHDTPASADKERDYDLIEAAGKLAKEAVIEASLTKLGAAVSRSYEAQLKVNYGHPSGGCASGFQKSFKLSQLQTQEMRGNRGCPGIFSPAPFGMWISRTMA